MRQTCNGSNLGTSLCLGGIGGFASVREEILRVDCSIVVLYCWMVRTTKQKKDREGRHRMRAQQAQTKP